MVSTVVYFLNAFLTTIEIIISIVVAISIAVATLPKTKTKKNPFTTASPFQIMKFGFL